MERKEVLVNSLEILVVGLLVLGILVGESIVRSFKVWVLLHFRRYHGTLPMNMPPL
jgi:regulator of protease activity HflC (stomatin/prohibitin superfamily)